MRHLFFIISIIAISCSSPQKNTTTANHSTQDQLKKSSNDDLLPICIRKLIDSFKTEEKQNPPRRIFSYLYNGKTVYYVTAPCCDFFSDLYDNNCNLIAHPDGGFTGRGDGKAVDFVKLRTNEKLIWADARK